MGIVIGSAVIPLWNLMTWDKANASGAIIAAWGGQLCGLIVWIITCSVESGEVSIKNLGNNWPMLLGNVAAIGSSGLIHATLSFGSPQNFDWKAFDEKVELVEDDQTGLDDADYDENFLNEALAWIKLWGCGLSVVLCVVWPILSVPAGVFTRDYFAFWVFGLSAWVGAVRAPRWTTFSSRRLRSRHPLGLCGHSCDRGAPDLRVPRGTSGSGPRHYGRCGASCPRATRLEKLVSERAVAAAAKRAAAEEVVVLE